MRNNSINQKGISTNTLIVGVGGAYQTLKDAVDWFNANATAHTEIRLDAGHHLIPATILVNNATYSLTIRGAGAEVTYLDADTGLTSSPMIELRTPCDINRVTLDGSTLASYGTLTGEDGVVFTTNANVYSEMTDIVVKNFFIGVSDAIGCDAFMFNFIISNCATGYAVDYTTAAITTSTDLEIGNFEGCEIGVHLKKATDDSFMLAHLMFLQTTATATAILYVPVDYVYGEPSNIMNVTYNEVGLFIEGPDFTLQRDADIEVVGCVGSEDRLPHAKINVLDNVSTTTITAGNTYYKAVFTNGDVYSCKIGLATANRMTFLSNHHKDGKVWIAGNLSVSNNGRNVNVALRKDSQNISTVTGNGTTTTVVYTAPHHLKTGNTVQVLGYTGGTGTPNGLRVITKVDALTYTFLSTLNGTATGGTIGQIISPMTVRCVTANVLYSFGLVAYIEGLGLNDYFELYVTDPNNGDTVVVSDINWLFVAQ